MTLTELMANVTVNPTFTGFVTNDDWVLAVDCGETAATDFTGAKDFAVVQMGVAGLDSAMNPITVDKTYIRAGQSTAKTGNQRSFAITGDRYIGDAFQDFALSHAIKYGTGQTVVSDKAGKVGVNCYACHEFGKGHLLSLLVVF